MLVPSVLSVVLSSLLLTAAGPDDLLSDPEAQTLVAEAQILFSEGNFGEAAKLIEKAYLIEPVPELLFPWAQAEREQGNCRAAIDLYGRLLEEIPEGRMADSARNNIALCEQEMPAEEAVVPVVEEDPLEEEYTEPEPEPVPEPVTKSDDQPKVKEWYKDPAGGVLTGLGVVGVGAGAALLIVANGNGKSASDAPSLDDYHSQSDTAVTQRNAGAGVLSVGGALLVAGVIRYVLVAKKNKASATASLWTAPGSGGVVFSGRF
ncbi:MAG: tetratricopeptide repeat protein [Nannocystales bacterium]